MPGDVWDALVLEAWGIAGLRYYTDGVRTGRQQQRLTSKIHDFGFERYQLSFVNL